MSEPHRARGRVPAGFAPVAAVECRMPEVRVLPQPDQVCMAVFEVVPVLYLLDAGDRAVRVRWPTDACGFLLDGGRETTAGLRETGRTTISVP